MEDYKTGDNYEAGLWSRRNIEAFLRDGNSINKLPIPAQQSVDRDTIINVLLSIGNMSEGIIADAIIGAIGAQQSPDYAAIRKWYVNLTNSDNVQDGINVNGKHCTDAMLDDLERILEQQSPVVAAPDVLDMTFYGNETLGSAVKMVDQSPRITEQDARDIVDHYRGHAYENGFLSETAFKWLEAGGRALLEKLNKPESVGG